MRSPIANRVTAMMVTPETCPLSLRPNENSVWGMAWLAVLCSEEHAGKPFSQRMRVGWRIGSVMIGLAIETAGLIQIVEHDFPVAQGQVGDEVAA